MPSFSWPIERRSEKTRRKHGPLPSIALLHARVRSPHVQRVTNVQSAHRPRADAADVRRKEHDGRLRPEARKIPDSGRRVQRQNVHEGSGRTNAQHSEQKFLLFRRVDSKQRENGRV